jgi:arylsulfatase A-like enzyme
VPERFVGKSDLAWREDKILWMNESVGKMLAAIDRLKLDDDTLVIFTADNGPVNSPIARDRGHLGAGPYRGLKTNVWDGGTRVPFLARWPGRIQAGGVTDNLIGLTDVLATIADLCGAPLPEGAGPDSVSQRASFLQEKDRIEERPALVTASNFGYLAIRKGKWKAIFGTKWSGGISSKKGTYGFTPPKGTPPDAPDIGQLYDISVDPFEQEDLWEKRLEVVESLRRELERIKQLDQSDDIRW